MNYEQLKSFFTKRKYNRKEYVIAFLLVTGLSFLSIPIALYSENLFILVILNIFLFALTVFFSLKRIPNSLKLELLSHRSKFIWSLLLFIPYLGQLILFLLLLEDFVPREKLIKVIESAGAINEIDYSLV